MAAPNETEIEVDTVLFDMDGTLIDSTPAVNQTWAEFAHQYNLDLDYVMERCHGYRTIENLKRFIPSLTDEELPERVKAFEGRIAEIADNAAKNGGPGGIVSLPGTKRLLEELSSGQASNPSCRPGWAIVTSATAAYAHVGFPAAKAFPTNPQVFVTSDLVQRGKPAPDPYLLGAKLSKADISKCIVVEDAPPGVLSGKAAGARVIGLKTTHPKKRMIESGADWVVEDLSKVHARWEGEKLFIRIEGEDLTKME